MVIDAERQQRSQTSDRSHSFRFTGLDFFTPSDVEDLSQKKMSSIRDTLLSFNKNTRSMADKIAYGTMLGHVLDGERYHELGLTGEQFLLLISGRKSLT